MNIYHSFWESDYDIPATPSDRNERIEKILILHELSVLCALKNYGNIHLITTNRGKELLGHLPYTSIEIFDNYLYDLNLNVNYIVNKYSNIWSLPKIFAYRQITKKGEKFLHIDYDVFLFKKLPDHVESANIICQSVEDEEHVRRSYNFSNFELNCSKKFFYDHTKVSAYNVGIFGGDDFNFFMFYTEKCLEFLQADENQSFWKNDPCQSQLLEQFWLTQCMEYKNLKPTFLLDPPYHDINKRAEELGYTHLLHNAKWFDSVINSVKSKIQLMRNL